MWPEAGYLSFSVYVKTVIFQFVLQHFWHIQLHRSFFLQLTKKDERRCLHLKFRVTDRFIRLCVEQKASTTCSCILVTSRPSEYTCCSSVSSNSSPSVSVSVSVSSIWPSIPPRFPPSNLRNLPFWNRTKCAFVEVAQEASFHFLANCNL